MDPALILIISALTIAILVLGLFLIRSSSKKNYKSKDGTSFINEEDCKKYDLLLDKLNCLYIDDDANQKSSNNLLGLKADFIRKIRTSSFPDLKTLLQYKADFIKLGRILEE